MWTSYLLSSNPPQRKMKKKLFQSSGFGFHVFTHQAQPCPLTLWTRSSTINACGTAVVDTGLRRSGVYVVWGGIVDMLGWSPSWVDLPFEAVGWMVRSGYVTEWYLTRFCDTQDRLIYYKYIYTPEYVCLRSTKFCWIGKHANVIMKPTNSPTQGQPNLRKNRLKSGPNATFGPLHLGHFFPRQILFRGLLVLIL